jgi:hypothetical protein
LPRRQRRERGGEEVIVSLSAVMDVIAALAVALGAFDAKHVELAFEPFLGFATAPRRPRGGST